MLLIQWTAAEEDRGDLVDLIRFSFAESSNMWHCLIGGLQTETMQVASSQKVGLLAHMLGCMFLHSRGQIVDVTASS